MAEERAQRRLAAILAADVVGYSRHMQQNETATHAALKSHLADLITPKIAEHIGRVVKTTGDGLLAEFSSAVAAVQCAVALQRGMAQRNHAVPEEKRLSFRIGINVGDIIVENKDIFGDGVIIAARLEGLSEPGGICISRTVRDQIRDKLPFEFADLGEQIVKNIVRPVRVFGLGAAAIATMPQTATVPSRPSDRRRHLWLGTGIAALLIVALLLGSIALFRPGPPSQDPSGWPSVSVLPFVNLSSERDQDYFSAGLTDDLLTDLARIPHLVVMPGTSKDAAGSPGGGARYAVSGTVRRMGEQMRTTVQLIEAATDTQVWAGNYDRPTTEIFTVQDEMTRAIAGALFVNMSQKDLERAKRKPPTSLSAYELFLRGREQAIKNTPEGQARAIEFYEQSLAVDPTYADAMGALAQAYSYGFTMHIGPVQGHAALARTFETAQRAFALDATSPYAARALSMAYLFTNRAEDAVSVLEQALKFNPSNDALLFRLGDDYTYAGEPERGIELLRQVYQLNPRYSGSGHAFIGRGLLLLNRHEEAIAELKICALASPTYRVCHEVAAVAYAEMNRLDEARLEAMEAHRLDPAFTLASAPEVLPFKDPQDLKRFVDGLRKAGLPE